MTLPTSRRYKFGFPVDDVRYMMSTKLTRKQIVISPKNYEALKHFGRVNDSFDHAVTEVLRLAGWNDQEAENPQRGIV